MDRKKLEEILDLHSKWLKDPSTGKRADLSGAVLNRADLSGAVLSEANLSGAYLRGVDLREADLRGAKFTVELRESKNLASLVVDRHYDPSQFSMLCLNPDFLHGQKTVVNS